MGKEICRTQAALMANMKALRAKKGWSQAEVGEMLNVASPTVSGWETGAKCPSLEVLEKLAEIYGVTVGDLFADSKSAPALMPAATTQGALLNHLGALVFSPAVRDFCYAYSEDQATKAFIPTFNFSLHTSMVKPLDNILYFIEDMRKSVRNRNIGQDFYQPSLEKEVIARNTIPLDEKKAPEVRRAPTAINDP